MAAARPEGPQPAGRAAREARRGGAARAPDGQLEERLAAGGRCKDPVVVEFGDRRTADLVFRTRRGMPVWQSDLADDLTAVCERAGIPRITPHGLRHAAVTLLADSGVDPIVTQRLAGHADLGMTTGVYTGVLDRLCREAVDRLAHDSPTPSVP